MTKENDKFVENMLKKAKEKKETKPHKRFSDNNQEDIEEKTKEILGWKEKKEE